MPSSLIAVPPENVHPQVHGN